MNNNTINADVTMGGSEGTLLASRYRVVRLLGQGGMGSVWLAEDTQLDNRQVAIKMLPSVLVSNKRAYQQLKAEALVSLKLTHPNIATVRAFEEDNGNPFLVVDYIDGITLDDYLADVSGRADLCVGRDGARPSLLGLPESEVVRLLSPIAAALDYAHSWGVVHRDVKPGNVMIAKDGTPYILDFGIAREIQETMTRVTGKLSSGTLMYMSPEQLHGAVPKSSQDVYSFAAMAYECLMGTPPFSRGQIEYQIEHDSPAPIDPQFAKCGAGIMAGLAKSPEDRPMNCAAVLAGCGGHGVTALPAEGNGSEGNGRARAPAAPQWGEKTVILPGGVKLELVWCPPGSFMMGSPDGEEGHYSDETQHRVTLTKGFWIGKYQVTQRQWESMMGSNPSCFKGENRPVERVSLENCQDFCRKVGLGIRLPTEAEWEYACRAGTTTAYAGTGRLDDMGWYDGNSAGGTHDVGTKMCNAWGIYVMHGNVWEWCSDLYGKYEGAAVDPTGYVSGVYNVNRGGCWICGARRCRSAGRSMISSSSCNDTGFRVCCSAGLSE